VIQPSKQQLVARGRFEVDDRELAGSIDRQEIDLATGSTGKVGVYPPQPCLERSFEFLDGRRDLLPGDLKRRPKQEGARGTLLARVRSLRLPSAAGVGAPSLSPLRQEDV
jgi:hypothetical protein